MVFTTTLPLPTGEVCNSNCQIGVHAQTPGGGARASVPHSWRRQCWVDNAFGVTNYGLSLKCALFHRLCRATPCIARPMSSGSGSGLVIGKLPSWISRRWSVVRYSFKRSWVILSALAKLSMDVARPLCDSWASCCPSLV